MQKFALALFLTAAAGEFLHRGLVAVDISTLGRLWSLSPWVVVKASK